MYRGEQESTQVFWWRKLNEKDRLANEQIKSHELCRHTDQSVAKPNTRQRLVFSFMLRPLYHPGKTPVTQCIGRFKFQYLRGGS